MSIENKVEKSIKTFYSSMKENIDYVDLNFRGIVNRTRTFTDDKGNKQSYTEQTVGVEGVACLRDKFRIWLMSDDGDYHRNPGVGGFLVKNVVKRPFIDSNLSIVPPETPYPLLETLATGISKEASIAVLWNAEGALASQENKNIEKIMM